MKNKYIKISISLLIGIFFVLIVRELIFNFFIPDSCVFHLGRQEEKGFWIRNFYYFSAVTGYHPAANSLNNTLTIISGICFGWLGYNWLLKKSN